MPRRTLQADTFYHIYNRGYNKQQLFFEERDYDKFLLKLEDLLTDFPDISCKAWCLLPNHFHFVFIEHPIPGSTNMEELEPGIYKAEQISQFMNRLQVFYARFFSVKYGDKIKKGLKMPVFEGRFKAKEVLDEAYLSQLVTYVEQNAVKHDLVDDIKDWPYSSWEAGRDAALDDDFFTDFE